jgi:hypothetical protein
MAAVYGVLGQSAPSAAVLTDMYTTPALKHTTGRIIVVNRGILQTQLRIALSPNGDAIADEHYVAYNVTIDGGATGSTIGIILGDGDVVRVWGGTSDLSFTLTGLEQDD